MLLILRDEDVSTVSSAITSVAREHGLEPVDPDEGGQDILALAAMIIGPRATLAHGEDFVLVDGLASLELGDADFWGKTLSSTCGNEVVAIEPAANGIRVVVFDDGEIDEDVAVDLDASGKTRSEELAEIAPSEAAAEELRAGVPALNAVELAAQVLRLFDAGEDRRTGEPTMLSFASPDDGDE